MKEQLFSISVVIPNYNGLALLKKNLSPLFIALETSNQEYEVILSDDASTDESLSFVEQEFPQMQCVTSTVNTGFSATVNRGLQHATKDLVMVLNSDVVLFPDYFLPCLKYFTKDETFGVMGRIIDLDSDQIQDAAKFPSGGFLKINSTQNYLPDLKKEPEMWWPSLFLSGANALISRSKLEILGGFDTLYSPFYVEDVDLSIRAWRLGWSSYYEHMAICRHPASTTIKSYHKQHFIQKISVRNRAFLHHIHLSDTDLFLWQLTLFLKAQLALLLWDKASINGIWMYFKDRSKANKSKTSFLHLANTLGTPPIHLMQVKHQLKEALKGKSLHKF